MSAQVPAPGLLRAVEDCTQPLGAPIAASVRSLQAYLANDRCRDIVYRCLVSRACTEPKSEPVIHKCVLLLKQYIPRYTPSPGVLGDVALCVQRLRAVVPTHRSDLQKSLSFLQVSVGRLAGASDGLVAARACGAPALPPDGVAARFEAGQARASVSSSATVSPRTSALADAGAPPQPSDASAVRVGRLVGRSTGDAPPPGSGGAASRYARSTSQHDALSRCSSEGAAAPLDAEASMGAESEGWRMPAGGRALPPNAPPPWALLDPTPSLLGAGSGVSTDWSDAAPQYSPGLAALVGGGQPAGSALTTSTTILEALPEAASDPLQALVRMREISVLRRARACAAAPGAAPQGRGGGGAAAAAMRRSAPHLHFHHTPYSAQDALQLAPGEVAAVVEAVVGADHCPVSPSAVLGRPADPCEVERRCWPPQLAGVAVGTSGGGGEDPLGQAAGVVLVKLVMDLWLLAGPEAATPLLLHMLQRGLHSPLPSRRARAFDLLYNLSLHACLLEEVGDDGSDGGEADAVDDATTPRTPGSAVSSDGSRGGGSAAGKGPPATPLMPPSPPSPRIHLPHTLLAAPVRGGVGNGATGTSGPNSPSSRRLVQSERRGWDAAPVAVTPAASAADTAVAGSEGTTPPRGLSLEFEAWLVGLLQELLLMVSQVEEPSEAVWLSALGALMHLATHGGHWVHKSVAQLPPAGVRSLMDAAVRFGWAPELHAQLATCAATVLLGSDRGVGEAAVCGALSTRLAQFGGSHALARHFCAAASPAAQRTMLHLLVCSVLPSDTLLDEAAAATGSVGGSARALAALQVALQAPQPTALADVVGAAMATAGAPASAVALALQGLQRVGAEAEGLASAGLAHLAPSIQLTLEHLRGDLGPGNAASASAAWGELQALAAQPEASAQGCARRWLQRLLQSVLQLSAEGIIPLPLPPPKGAASESVPPPAQSQPPAVAQLVATLQLLVSGQVPRGPELLVEALQLEAWALQAQAHARSATSPQPAPPPEAGRAAAKAVVNAWALVLQWVLQGAWPACHHALARLSGMALALTVSPLDAHPVDRADGSRSALRDSSVAADSAASATGSLADSAYGGEGAVAPHEAHVCAPQAFLLGQAGMCAATSDALPGAALASLVARHQLSTPPATAAARGVTGRPAGSASAALLAAALAPDAQPPALLGPLAPPALPFELLLPWSEAAADQQLALLLMVVGRCIRDAASVNELGVEALAHAVLGSCLDARHCYYLSLFLMWHLSTHARQRYWRGLRALVVQAQAVDDERVLGNPFLTAGTLLNMR